MQFQFSETPQHRTQNYSRIAAMFRNLKPANSAPRPAYPAYLSGSDVVAAVYGGGAVPAHVHAAVTGLRSGTGTATRRRVLVTGTSCVVQYFVRRACTQC